MKHLKKLSIAYVFSSLILLGGIVYAAGSFSDVSFEPYFYPHIENLYQQHLITGDTEFGDFSGLFYPNDSINRAEFTKITVITRLAEKYGVSEGWDNKNTLQVQEVIKEKLLDYFECTPQSCSSIGGVPFKDVAEKDKSCEEKGMCEPWYTQYVYYAVDQGFIKGYGSGTYRYFNPQNNILRINALKMVIADNGNIPAEDDSRYQLLDTTAYLRWSYAPKCLRGAEDYIRSNNGGNTQDSENLLKYALLADRLDFFGNECQIFKNAKSPQARADFLQKSLTRKEAARYYALASDYPPIEVDSHTDETVNAPLENQVTAAYDLNYTVPLFGTVNPDFIMPVADTNNYYPNGNNKNKVVTEDSLYEENSLNLMNNGSDPFGSTANQIACPAVICDSTSEEKCVSIYGPQVKTIGELIYGAKYRYSSLWQMISFNGQTKYAPYDVLNLGCGKSISSTIVSNSNNYNNNSGSSIVKDIETAFGITSKIEVPVYGKSVPYTWTMNNGGTYLAKIYQTNSPNKYFALDYGYNVKTDSANLHLNKKSSGLYNDWGHITDHQVIGPKDLELKIKGEPFRPKVSPKFGPVPLNVAKGVRYLGTAGLAFGAASDAYNIYKAEDKSKEVAKVAGGWTGAYMGAEIGGVYGATTGAFVGPLGALIGGAAGGLIGGTIGYITGVNAGEVIHNEIEKLSEKYKFW